MSDVHCLRLSRLYCGQRISIRRPIITKYAARSGVGAIIVVEILLRPSDEVKYNASRGRPRTKTYCIKKGSSRIPSFKLDQYRADQPMTSPSPASTAVGSKIHIRKYNASIRCETKTGPEKHVSEGHIIRLSGII